MGICDKTGKHMFPTRRSAVRSIKGVARRGKLQSRAETYYCRSCKSWHFGRSKVRVEVKDMKKRKNRIAVRALEEREREYETDSY